MTELTIRPGTLFDLEAITSIYNHYVINTSATFDLQAFATEDRITWFEQFNDGRHPIFVATLLRGGNEPALVGYAYAATFRKKPAYDNTVETTIYIAPDEAGKGVGQRLYEHLLAHLDRVGVRKSIAVITLPNDASIALHNRLGFERAGVLTEVGYKFNQHWDTLWLQRSGPSHRE